ncbi:MAG: hypothetical protein CMK59_05260 [Proteobacteria bacterium]|nr:hypothetical protein [Pseudomonadota bacterium]
MFGFGTSLASVYDYIYLWKDYHKEARRIIDNLSELGCTEGVLLELACGTGRHLEFFNRFRCMGVDLCEESLMLASFRSPQASFLCQDMRQIGYKESDHIDVLMLLFGGVSYIKPQELRTFFEAWAGLMNDDSVLVLEPWYEDVQEGGFLQAYDSDELKICRMSDVRQEDHQTVMDFSFLIARSGGSVERLSSQERLWNHPHHKIESELQMAGFKCVRKSEGFSGLKGLWFLQKT